MHTYIIKRLQQQLSSVAVNIIIFLIMYLTQEHNNDTCKSHANVIIKRTNFSYSTVILELGHCSLLYSQYHRFFPTYGYLCTYSIQHRHKCVRIRKCTSASIIILPYIISELSLNQHFKLEILSVCRDCIYSVAHEYQLHIVKQSTMSAHKNH